MSTKNTKIRVVVALPDGVRPDSNPYGFPWELVIRAALVGFFAVPFFLYVEREKKACCNYEGHEVESFLKDASFEKEATEAQSLEVTCGKLNRFNVELEDKILCLEKELKEEKYKHSEQGELMADISKRIQSLEDKTTEDSIKDALNENSQLQKSQKQLLQEAEVEPNKQKIIFEDSKESYTQNKLAMLGEDITDDANLELEMNNELENSAYLDNPPKGALKKLIHAAKLNASLKTLDGERNQIYIQLSEADKTKEELREHIKNLQTEQASLQSENTRFEKNEMKPHRKLRIEENYRLEKEEKFSKVDKKISHATEEMETYRKRGRLFPMRKKAHGNWLAAQTAERNLNDLRKENAHKRQKLTETGFKFELLEKDLYALDVPNKPFGREHSPYGPSPLGQASSETRAFLSRPTLLEGPLRFSPLFLGGGGRGSRGPRNPLDHKITNERGESSFDMLTNSHKAPSDTGSVSPPGEQDHRMMFPPPGQSYPDSALPPQRQARFYSNSGRLSGPIELRSFYMPLDKMDGSMPSEMESSRNDTKDDLGNFNVPDSSLRAENGATGPGFVPPPLAPFRGSLFPVDTRGPFMRRGPPFPPPLPGTIDFPGPPHAPFAMRNFPSGLIPPSNEPATDHSEPQQET
uniref:Uncharacterized protein n=1 Tax=Aotus nancymaae TaxID=37293 RepID=A0A2K5ELP7_AOTNA